jgi:hypothetical protein
MARTAQLVVLGLVLAALLQTAQAATDKSAACQAALAACEAKCTGYDFQFSCSARHKPDGPRCRCTKLLQAESAPQSELGVLERGFCVWSVRRGPQHEDQGLRSMHQTPASQSLGLMLSCLPPLHWKLCCKLWQ